VASDCYAASENVQIFVSGREMTVRSHFTFLGGGGLNQRLSLNDHVADRPMTSLLCQVMQIKNTKRLNRQVEK
jgi:hypothetical protein